MTNAQIRSQCESHRQIVDDLHELIRTITSERDSALYLVEQYEHAIRRIRSACIDETTESVRLLNILSIATERP